MTCYVPASIRVEPETFTSEEIDTNGWAFVTGAPGRNSATWVIDSPDFFDASFVSTPAFCGEEILVPTFELACNPTIQLSEIKARRFYIDNAKINAAAAIQRGEDQAIFDAINGIMSNPGYATISVIDEIVSENGF